MSENKIKNIAIIGSTGSIGRQTVDVALAHPDKFRIVGIAANKRSRLFTSQVKALQPEYHALAQENEKQALAVASLTEADVVVVACGGFAGLKYSLAALEAGKTLALANKETLVCGGDLVTAKAREKGVEILPVDSEHSAIWQCLGFDVNRPFKRLLITASGGPFRGYTKAQLKAVTPKDALRHPVWNMGAKITIDSATMLNKGFEIIEAHHLFGAEYGRITAILHPQSIVHSMVEFEDGAVLAQLSNPDMHLPIQAALCHPERIACPDIKPMDFTGAVKLDFGPVEKGKYPCFDIALECAAKGGNAPVLLNAASEVAAGLFLEGRLPFTDIYSVIADVLNVVPCTTVKNYDDACAADNLARQLAATVALKYTR